MHAVGLIVEYNPFHRGHLYHLQQAKSLADTDFAIGVMSGHFLQRGEPALFDKWNRAKMAVLAGVDLVLELPVAFAARSAAYFAAGGVRLLGALGVVSHICFGCETADLTVLTRTAAAIDSPQVAAKLHQRLSAGCTYAAALAQALDESGVAPVNLTGSPNNILAIEYIRAIHNYAPQLTPLPIKRQQAGYHDLTINGDIASSSAIRRALLTHRTLDSATARTLPPTSIEIINKLLATGQGPITLAAYEQMILARLRTADLDDLAQLPDVGEGLHFSIHKAAREASDITSLLSRCKSKRYTQTRLQRILIHTLLGTTKQQLRHWDTTGPLYARVLAFNDRGRKLLKIIKSKAAIPVITKTADFLNSNTARFRPLTDPQQMLALDILASDLYVLGFPQAQWRTGGWDYLHSPVYVTIQPDQVGL